MAKTFSFSCESATTRSKSQFTIGVTVCVIIKTLTCAIYCSEDRQVMKDTHWRTGSPQFANENCSIFSILFARF